MGKMKIFALLLLFAFSEALKLENIEIDRIARDLIGGNRISIKEIIDGVLKNIEGHKENRFPLVEIDAENRLQDVIIESNVSAITNDMDDTTNLRKIDIRNLTIPVSMLKVRGEYKFEGLSLFDLLIYGQGDIKIDITDLKIFLSMKANYRTSGGWRVTHIDADTSVKHSRIRLENLMNGEPMGDFLNFMVDELFKVGIDLLNGLVNQYKKEIMQVLQKILNSILDTEQSSFNK